ncbi:predicted protein [Histoplasma mississippiense (nom. inval.)]|uniref:predicted protein n=1 Tax=Ajellomyces capsulatus (strain NAm1 / WU24) TaxID=2059318 RepID=UPI000157CB89|nr:predicted protein [Histoplasma mississippiense (nom. inval.)]EDN10255.1 predicted protein [Histoplasma mississippiense (nom. inval.)]
MAAPAEVTVHDLNGTWVMDSSLSNDPDAIFKLQGMSWLTRKAIGLATVTLKISQKTTDAGVVELTIDQVLTGGVRGTSELRVLDWSERPHQDHIFGSLTGQSRFCKADASASASASAGDSDGKRQPTVDVQTKAGSAAEDVAVAEFLRGETLADGEPADGFAIDGANEDLLQSWVRSLDNGWTAEQIWGFERIEGVRRYTRRVVVAKGGEVQKVRLVYTFMNRSTE